MVVKSNDNDVFVTTKAAFKSSCRRQKRESVTVDVGRHRSETERPVQEGHLLGQGHRGVLACVVGWLKDTGCFEIEVLTSTQVRSLAEDVQQILSKCEPGVLSSSESQELAEELEWNFECDWEGDSVDPGIHDGAPLHGKCQ